MELRDAMVAFVRVVEAGTFAAAAREMHMPKSTLSRWMTALEDRLGAQLLVRTTRRVSLTDAGQVFYGRCRDIAAAIEEAEAAVHDLQGAPRGILRVTTMAAQSGFLSDLLLGFQEAFPQVELEVFSTSRFVNLEAEGFDVAIRAGQLPDSTLKARLLARTRLVLVASPAYLDKYGAPSTPAELVGRPCVLGSGNSDPAVWRMADGTALRVRGPIQTNALELALAAALRGVGIARVPDRLADPLLASGALVELLPGSLAGAGGLYVVYPPSRHLAVKVQVFVDYVTAWFAAGGLEATAL